MTQQFEDPGVRHLVITGLLKPKQYLKNQPQFLTILSKYFDQCYYITDTSDQICHHNIHSEAHSLVNAFSVRLQMYRARTITERCVL